MKNIKWFYLIFAITLIDLFSKFLLEQNFESNNNLIINSLTLTKNIVNFDLNFLLFIIVFLIVCILFFATKENNEKFYYSLFISSGLSYILDVLSDYNVIFLNINKNGFDVNCNIDYLLIGLSVFLLLFKQLIKIMEISENGKMVKL